MKRAGKKNEDLHLEKPYASCPNMKDSKNTTVLNGINNDQAGGTGCEARVSVQGHIGWLCLRPGQIVKETQTTTLFHDAS